MSAALQLSEANRGACREFPTGPVTNVIWPSCDAGTSMTVPGACCTPLTYKCPLAASRVESQNWYSAIARPFGPLTANRLDAATLWLACRLTFEVVTTGTVSICGPVWVRPVSDRLAALP